MSDSQDNNFSGDTLYLHVARRRHLSKKAGPPGLWFPVPFAEPVQHREAAIKQVRTGYRHVFSDRIFEHALLMVPVSALERVDQ